MNYIDYIKFVACRQFIFCKRMVFITVAKTFRSTRAEYRNKSVPNNIVLAAIF